MATTMREVAEAAGVSIATVSFVVDHSNDGGAGDRERIERVMAELRFAAGTLSRVPWPADEPDHRPRLSRCSRTGWPAR